MYILNIYIYTYIYKYIHTYVYTYVKARRLCCVFPTTNHARTNIYIYI